MLKYHLFSYLVRGRAFVTTAFLILALTLLISVLGQPSLAALEDQPFPVVPLPEEAQSAPIYLASGLSVKFGPLGKLDSVLQELVLEYKKSPIDGQSFAQNRELRMMADRVQVLVEVAPGEEQSAAAAIASLGGTVTYISELAPELQAWIPLLSLETTAQESSILAIKRPARLVSIDEAAVAATSEGLLPLNALAWHTAGELGAAVKIAVIDGGFQGYPTLLGTDLPASVTVKNFVDGENDSQVDGTTIHGTACAEIAFDIAPNADYYLVKIDTNLDLQEAVSYAISQGVDVISTSLGWYNVTPGDGTGQFADLADLAKTNDIVWMSAAGNDRQVHWGGIYNDPELNDIHNFNGLQEVNYYGPGDGNAYVIPPGTVIRVFVRWDDWQVVDQDYALHLFYFDGSYWQLLVTSDQPQTGLPGQKPTEELLGTFTGSAAPIGFVIQRINSSRPVNFEMFAPKVAPLDESIPDRSLVNLADAPAVVTVGAVAPTSPYALESYSSQGPTNGLGGTVNGGWLKPDITAYAGVSTESYGVGAFSGTSASTPHVAGAAALVKGAIPGFSPQQTRDYLLDLAEDLGSTGPDTEYGHGRAFLGDPPTTHQIQLNEGWNMISSYTDPADPTLETLLAGIESNMLLMKDGDGHVYWPDQNIDEIVDWNVLSGYQIFMTGADTLSITGQLVDPVTAPIDLLAGWNQVAYLRDGSLAVDQALDGISSELYLAKNGFGEVYWSDYNVNLIGNMEPGEGYQLFMSSSGTLTYPAN